VTEQTPDPFSQPPVYGGPNYGAPGYGQATPAQPAYGQPAYGPMYPPPPSRKKRDILIVTGAVVALVAFVTAIIVVAYNRSGNPAGPKRTLALPSTSGDYTAVPGAIGDRIAELLQRQLSTAGASLSNAQAGVYSKGGGTTPAMVLFALTARGNPDFARELRSRSAKEEAKEVLDGAGATSYRTYDAGPLGGVLQCSTVNASLTQAPVCVWVDKSTVGLTVATAGQQEAAFAADTLTMRNDTES
jgi:hypothetical protein